MFGHGETFQSSPVAVDGCEPERHPRRRRLRRVSILTRRRGRVRARASATSASDREFQSSPVAVDGCERGHHGRHRTINTFQSSPVAVDGCEHRRTTHMAGTNAFQSSPVAVDGCEATREDGSAGYFRFQSSPVAVDGCEVHDARHHRRERVSILTRRRGRVRDGGQVIGAQHVVSILTRRRGRVRGVWQFGHMRSASSFQSSPVAVDGCELLKVARQVVLADVSILTRRRGRVRDPPGSSRRSTPCFNPHPSPWTGARSSGM